MEMIRLKLFIENGTIVLSTQYKVPSFSVFYFSLPNFSAGNSCPQFADKFFGMITELMIR
jgi:hypothetical protein